MRKLLYSLLVLVLLVPTVLAASEFELKPIITDQISCASETVLYIFEVKNTGTATESYTVRLSGSPSKWAVAAPAGFMLAPGKSESVYVYLTPSVFALSGTYKLDVSVAGQLTSSQTLPLSLEVSDCHSAVFEAARDSAEVCSSTQVVYDLVLENTGRFRENFELSLSGNGATYATLSDELVALNSGQSKNIQVFATPVGDAVGDFTITATAKSQNSRATASKRLQLTSNACYDYNVALDTNFISTCEASEVRVPVTVRNSGTADNNYEVIVAGPRWAHAENIILNVPAGGIGQTEVVLAPDFGVKGTFDVDVRIKDQLGDTIKSQKISAKVDMCYTFDLKLERSRDTLCPFNDKTYEISLINTGKFPENYVIDVTGADFASVDRGFVALAQGEATKLNLIVAPAGAREGNYKINVAAKAQGKSQSSSSEVLNLDIADLSACFGVQATSALTTVEVVAGEGALVPVIIENKGTETSSYNLEVSGSGASYAQLNPASVTLEGRKAQTVYMYISVPDQTPQENYKITVSARLADGTVSSSTNVNVLVKPAGNIAAATQDETPRERFTELVSSIIDKIRNAKNKVKASISGAFVAAKDAMPAVQQPILETKLPEPEIVNQPEPKKETINETEIVNQPEIKTEETEPSEARGAANNSSPGTKLPEPETQPEIINNAPKSNTISFPSLSEMKNFFTESVIWQKLTNRITQPTNEINSTRTLPSFPNIRDLDTSALTYVFDKGASKLKVVYDKGLDFAGKKTYDVNNAAWMSAILLVLIAIALLFFTGRNGKPETNANTDAPKKNIWSSFSDFLEEDDEEPKTEAEIKPEEVKSTDSPDLIGEQNLDEAVQRWRETPEEIFPDKVEEKPKTKRAVKKPKKNKTTKKKDN